VGEWTLEELVRRAGQALVAADVRPSNGRVTETPDGRMIRWYSTIGLVDRPSGHRGRVALYGPRHLLQVVAVKRLQASGRTLAEIQIELAGATDAQLRHLAALPTLEETAAPPRPVAVERRFWADPTPAAAPAHAPSPAAPAPSPATSAAAPSPAISAPAPAAADPAGPASAPAGAAGPAPAASPREIAVLRDHGALDSTTIPDGADLHAQDPLVHGVTLAPGVVLLLPGRPEEGDVAAIRAAATTLIDTLARRGLIQRDQRSPA